MLRPTIVGAQEGAPQALPAIKVVGMGSCGQDLLAQVASFPRPDDKLRTETMQTQGGGNCGNALTAAARLGLRPALISKIGGDGVGDSILGELRRDGVDTGCVLRAQGAPSPFTYIIVDRQGGTRTCIHTPGEPMLAEEVSAELAAATLEGAALAYFDGRLTEAALVLAAEAQRRGVPLLVEAERLRPGLEQLLSMADYVVTSTHFPASWTGEQCLGDALLTTLSRLPRARWLVTTLGSRGSVLLEPTASSALAATAAVAAGVPQHREAPAAAPDSAVVLDELLPQLFEQAAAASDADAASSSPPAAACLSASGLAIAAGGIASTPASCLLRLRRGDGDDGEVPPEVQAARHAAAAAAAAANADAANAAGYSARPAADVATPGGEARCLLLEARVTAVQAAQLPPEAVVDTTGAGDAFIGSLLYGVATGKPVREAMALASVVAARKCTALGARMGLPRRADLRPDLL